MHCRRQQAAQQHCTSPDWVAQISLPGAPPLFQEQYPGQFQDFTLFWRRIHHCLRKLSKQSNQIHWSIYEIKDYILSIKNKTSSAHLMVFHTRGWRLNRLNGVGFCRELSGILQTCCFSWKGHIWVQKWHQPKGVKYISRMETNNRLDANEYQLTEEQRGRQSQLHDSYKEIS